MECSIEGAMECSIEGSNECSIEGAMECSIEGSNECSIEGSIECSVAVRDCRPPELEVSGMPDFDRLAERLAGLQVPLLICHN